MNSSNKQFDTCNHPSLHPYFLAAVKRGRYTHERKAQNILEVKQLASPPRPNYDVNSKRRNKILAKGQVILRPMVLTLTRSFHCSQAMQ